MNASSSRVGHVLSWNNNDAWPAGSFRLIERPALMTRLTQSLQGRVSLVRTPAGYGKTVLLQSWARELRKSDVHVLWVSVDAELAEPLHFVAEITGALANLAGDQQGEAETVYRELQGSTLGTAVRRFVDLAGSVPKSLVIVVDDYARISHDELDKALGDLIERCPNNVHFAIAMRTNSVIPLGNLWLNSNTTRFDVEDLRFTDSEIACVFDQQLEPDQLAQLSAWTEGWPVAVAMVRQHFAKGKITAAELTQLLGEATGDIDRYLMDQMIRRLPEGHIEFLIKTSFLEAISDSIADAIMEHPGSGLTLQDLALSNALISPLDETGIWYRCHHLLRRVMYKHLRRRGEEELARLQRLAADWHHKQGNFRDACRLASEAGDFDMVAQIIADAGGIFYVVRYGVAAFEALIEYLPRERIGEFPRLRVAQSHVLTLEGRYDLAAEIVGSIRRRIDQAAAGSGNAADPVLLRDMAFAELARASYCATEPRKEDILVLERAVEQTTKENTWLRGLLNNLLALVHYRVSDLPAALRAAESALFYFAQSKSLFNVGHMRLMLGYIYMELGELETALDSYHAARNCFAAALVGDESFCATADVMIAEALYEKGQVHQAHSLCVAALPIAEAGNAHYELLVVGYRTATALSLATSDLATASDMLDRAIIRIRRSRFPAVERFLALYRLELEGFGGATCESFAVPDLMPSQVGMGHQASWREVDLRTIVGARSLFDAGDHGAGIAKLIELRNIAAGQGRIRTGIIASIEMAIACEAMGDWPDAKANLHDAIALAVPSQILRPFFERGLRLMPLLLRLIADDAQLESSKAEFINSAIHVWSKSNDVMSTVLKDREREIMHLLASDMSNKLIARRLEISPETVRFHLKKIYDKFGTNDRKVIMELARKFSSPEPEAF